MEITSRVNVPVTKFRTRVFGDGSVVAGYQYYDPVNYYVSEVDRSATNPRYKREIAAAVNAGTSLSGVIRHVKPFTSNIEYTRTVPSSNPAVVNQTNIEMSTDLGSYKIENAIPGSAGLEGKADSVAKGKFLQKAYRARTAFQGGVFLGELTKTISLIRSPAQALRRGVDDYLSSAKKLKRRERNRRARRSAVADTWLEYSYAWTPLVNDVRDGYEAAKKVFHTIPQKYIVGEGEASEAQSGFIAAASAGSGRPSYNMYGEKTCLKHVKYYGTVGVGRVAGRLPEHVGLNLRSFVPTAWELIPYSFLVDYFSNVGDIITALAVNRNDIRWVMKLVRSTYSYQGNRSVPTIGPPAGNTITNETVTLGSGMTRTVARAKYSGSLIPSLVFELPGAGRKWINISALARNHKSLLPFF